MVHSKICRVCFDLNQGFHTPNGDLICCDCNEPYRKCWYNISYFKGDDFAYNIERFTRNIEIKYDTHLAIDKCSQPWLEYYNNELYLKDGEPKFAQLLAKEYSNPLNLLVVYRMCQNMWRVRNMFKGSLKFYTDKWKENMSKGDIELDL